MTTRPAFEVVRSSPQTTIQDMGRAGYLHTGMPQSGAQDPWSLKVANRLVGNDVGGAFGVQSTEPGDAGLEVLLPGLLILALADSKIAITGADLDARVNGESVPMWTTLPIREGDEVSLKGLKTGLRAYVAIAGGLAVEPVLGSRATYVRGAIGGIEGRELRPGDVLNVYDKPTMKELYQVPEDSRDAYQMGTVRVVFGPQDHLYTEEARRTFLAEPWRLLPEADRMGFRMEGPTLGFETSDMTQKEYSPPYIVDDFIPLGGIQTPSDGLIIAMGVEGPSLGGFAKIATVISIDFGVLAQTKPGQSLGFEAVSWEEAVALSAQAQSRVGGGEILEKA